MLFRLAGADALIFLFTAVGEGGIFMKEQTQHFGSAGFSGTSRWSTTGAAASDIGQAAPSGVMGWKRNRGKPGYEFVVSETAQTAIRAVGREAVFLIPSNRQGMRLIKTATTDTFNVISSQAGQITSDGKMKKSNGDAVMDEVGMRLLQTTSRGADYQATAPLDPGVRYALYHAPSDMTYQLQVEQCRPQNPRAWQ